MSGGNSINSVVFNLSAQWFTLPPFVALITVTIVSFFTSGAVTPVDDAVWGLVGLLFVLLTVLYGLFIRQDFPKGLLPVQIIAQGLFLCPLSLQWGARMFQWLGVAMTVCGSVALMVIYYRFYHTLSTQVYVAAPSELDALPLLCVVTDGEGNVVSVSNALLHLAQKLRMEVEGKKITALLPINEETIDLGGTRWKILQSPMEGGMYCFNLEEVQDPPLPSFEERIAFADPATSLCTRAYAEKRVNEELYRIRRYQRWMSAALLRMVFQGTENQIAKEDEIFEAYCRFIRSSTRETDIPSLVGPRDILVVMPETQLHDAEEVVGKFTDFVPPLQKELKNFSGAAEIKDSVVFFDSSSGDLNFDQALNKLDEVLEV
jgi:hypothetical protein